MAAPTPAQLLRDRRPRTDEPDYPADFERAFEASPAWDESDSPAAFRAREKYREAQADWADIAGEAVQ